LEALRTGVAKKAVHELASLGMGLEGRQIPGPDEELPRADAGFEQEAQLMIAGEIVDPLDDRTEVRRGG